MAFSKNTFQGTTALVTGAGRGIGEATAILLASLGAKVALVSRTESELKRVSSIIQTTYHSESPIFVGDISDEKTILDIFSELNKNWGPINYLVNNAGIFNNSLVQETTLSSFNQVIGVNLTGSFLCSREFFRQKSTPNSPRAIVNVASIAGIRGIDKFKGFSSYIASKHAVVGLTEALALEGKDVGIRVNAIAPGAVDTDMLKRAAPHVKTQTTPDKIAQTIVSLLDPEISGHLTGSILEIFSNL